MHSSREVPELAWKEKLTALDEIVLRNEFPSVLDIHCDIHGWEEWDVACIFMIQKYHKKLRVLTRYNLGLQEKWESDSIARDLEAKETEREQGEKLDLYLQAELVRFNSGVKRRRTLTAFYREDGDWW